MVCVKSFTTQEELTRHLRVDHSATSVLSDEAGSPLGVHLPKPNSVGGWDVTTPPFYQPLAAMPHNTFYGDRMHFTAASAHPGRMLPWAPGTSLLLLDPMYVTGLVIPAWWSLSDVLNHLGLSENEWAEYIVASERRWKPVDELHKLLSRQWMMSATSSHPPGTSGTSVTSEEPMEDLDDSAQWSDWEDVNGSSTLPSDDSFMQ